MNDKTTRTGGSARRATRLTIAIAAALSLGIAVFATSASAQTVYNYAYSGTYFDGSDVGKTFNAELSGLTYDRNQHVFIVSNGGAPAWIGKFKENGEGVNFSSLGTPVRVLEGTETSARELQVAVDQTGGATEGNLFVFGSRFSYSGYIHAYNPDGTEVPNFGRELTEENSCGVAVDPSGEEIVNPSRNGMQHATLDGEPTYTEWVGSPGLEPGVKFKWEERGRACKPVYDNEGNVYGYNADNSYSEGTIVKLDPHGLEFYEVNQHGDSVAVAVDQSDNNVFVLRKSGSFEEYDSEGRLLGSGWGGPDLARSYDGILSGSVGITVDPSTHAVWIADKREYAGGVRRVEKFVPVEAHVIPETTALAPGYEDPSGAVTTLRGSVNPEGEPTTLCKFEYGSTQALGEEIDCIQGQVISGSSAETVTAHVNLPKGSGYFYRLETANANGQVALSNIKRFIPQGKPKIEFDGVNRVNTDGVQFNVEFDPNGGNASYHFEWGQNGNFENTTPESSTFGFTTAPGIFEGTNTYEPGLYLKANLVNGLTPGTTYEYRVVVTNEAGSTVSEPLEFTTYVPDVGRDTCPNAQVRQETEGSLLPDCRAYELVSARNTGGFDVESDLVSGQEPLEARPHVSGKLLYSIHDGVIPGVAGSPTNYGLDPYLATRGAEGWTTKYVGVPADGTPDKGAYGSPLLGTDAGLNTFAFGGAGICNPCFGDGSINVPLRLPDGSLVKGMAGPLSPAAQPAGQVREPLSADGSHFVFGSEKPFISTAPAGLAIYERDLGSNATQVVSTDTSGSYLSGELAELAISANGERVLIGKRVGEDANGNATFDLYMHVGEDPDAVLVAETPHGVVFNGMTSDGSMVFFTTIDQLAGDTDHSADFYRADVGSSGSATITRLSTGSGGAGNTDACTPITNWNALSGGPNCSTVALAGGSGIAAEKGTAYFLSPELLDGSGNGEAGEVNLYVSEPGQSSPRFVATIDSSAVKPPPQPPSHPVVSDSRVSGLSSTVGLTIDQSNGDIYVVQGRSGGQVLRYTPAGVADNFTAGSGAGTNVIANPSPGSGGEGQIAVDNASGSPMQGDFYVRSGTTSVRVYAPSGEKVGELTGFGDVCGVAVEQSTGAVYVGDFGRIRRFMPTTAATPVTNANYDETSLVTEGVGTCNVAADNAGHVYAVNWPSGPVSVFNKSDFQAVPQTVAGNEVDVNAYALAVDPETNDLYVSEGNQIAEFDSNGNLVEKFGAEHLSSSRGVGVNAQTKHVFALSGTKVVEFGYEEHPYEPIDNPAAVHGVRQAAQHDFEDFQVTPDGHYAVFNSAVPLTGALTLGHTQIYRYDAETGSIACPSCAPTGAVAAYDTMLSGHGLNLTNDGRVFFTTLESFTLRDTNEKLDAYEWNEGHDALISTGIGQDDSGLVTASADGKDAFFYTRETLSPQDESGNVVKIYDARENGGYPVEPPRQPCKASDECHGPGSPVPPAPDIKTVTGSGAAPSPVGSPAAKCRKGFVKRHAKCVKKRKHRHHRKHAHHRRHKKKRHSKRGRG